MPGKSFFSSIAACFRGQGQDDRVSASNPQIPKAIASLEDFGKPQVIALPTAKLPILERRHQFPYRISGTTLGEKQTTQQYEPNELIRSIRDNVVGEGQMFHGPFGDRRITYADYVASGRSLGFIEDYIRQQVLPLYANTHSEVSYTGRAMCQLREEARHIIHESVGGSPDDVVIALGSGSTAAINRMVQVLGLTSDKPLPPDRRPVVFIGPYEHHSNDLPWRESIAEVIRIPSDKDGHIDQAHLAEQLVRYSARPLRVGSFSAASNVTGILSDTDGITALLHQHGALAFWDYAAAAPYVNINMNPDRGCASGLRNKDAVFISPHKFIGGPGTPGLLVVKRSLLQNRVPSVPGGGTVSFVTPDRHRYLTDAVHREEGGTPAIVEMVRAGLVFQLKDKVGAATIERREQAFVKTAINHWRQHPRIQILGSHDAARLSVVSFLVKDGRGQTLHQNFVVALLNDLFGIQARGGCSCAGPYGHDLLNIGLEQSRTITDAIAAGYEGVKPGWVRLNFNYFISKAVFTFMLDAVDFIADHASAFLGQYKFDIMSGVWTHVDADASPILALGSIVYSNRGIVVDESCPTASEKVLPKHLVEARQLAMQAGPARPRLVQWPQEVESIRWFPIS
ncbi:class V aminotransferase [Stachybotrys elegans]|uniref:Class V aminotransferase n=1 Tax=Stachybotrys elegans TaxID=80388 RepID=A0A8K0SL65_9HYPO|nr:class V aminotransferase [Stachybotrys elegans]